MKTILTTLLIAISFGAVGQQYAIKQFTVDDGLPSSHVYEVKQDNQGFLWIATDEGVVKYDGYSFQRMRQKNNPFNEEVWWTYQDSNDRIWGLTLGLKLAYADGDSVGLKQMHFNRGVHQNVSFKNLWEDEYGYYWLTYSGWLFRFKAEEYEALNSEDKTGVQGGQSHPEMHQTKDRETYYITKAPVSVWKTNGSGNLDLIYRYSSRIFKDSHRFSEDHLPETGRHLCDSNITFIYRSYDTLYSITDGQLTGYISGVEVELGLFPSANEMRQKSNYRVICLRDKYVFIRTSGSFVTDLEFNHLAEFDFLAEYAINTIFQDREGSLWISTDNQGLFYLVKDALASKTPKSNHSSETEIIGIETSTSGDIWIAYKNAFIGLYRDEQLKCFEVLSKKSSGNRWLLHDFKIVEDYMIVGVGFNEIRVYKISEDLFSTHEPLSYKDGLTSIKSINTGSKSELFITDYFATWKLVPDEESVFKFSKNEDRWAQSFMEIKNGNTLYSTRLGLYQLSKNDSTMLDVDILADKFLLDLNNDVWIPIKGGGVSKFIDNALEPVVALDNYLVRDLFFESDSIVWAATNQGLVQLKRDARTGKFEYKKKLTLANGLLTNDVTAIRTDSNNLYIGTTKGFNVIDRSRLSNSALGYPVMLNQVLSNGTSFGVSNSYNLEPSFNSIEFQYVYVSPKSVGQIRYRYKLDGIDSEWKETRETTVRYPFLPAGSYTFRLEARDINGVSSTKNIELHIVIQQYWWKTTWFYLLLGLIVFAIMVTAFFLRAKKLRKKERERTVTNNRLAEMKLNALQSQMNPHFIFNVLNSIQDSFISNQVVEANKYLSDFSSLMRLFLESSDDKYISLEKEIKLLTYYIELEIMRLENKFSFEFRISEDLETDEVFIPTMLLQPIVENAIIHGIRYKEGPVQLIIAFSLRPDEKLHISIKDNGVGRERSAEINRNRRNDHVSKATGIVRERIEIINNSSVGFIDMKYVDLSENGTATGTKVELMMQLDVNR